MSKSPFPRVGAGPFSFGRCITLAVGIPAHVVVPAAVKPWPRTRTGSSYQADRHIFV
jgi:hypothetical protein